MGQQYYNKPKYELMKDFIRNEMRLQKGKTFTKSWFIDEFKVKYPRFADSGIKMSLCRLSVNDPNRYRYNPSQSDDFLWKVDGHTYRLYDKANDNFSSVSEKNAVKSKPYAELIKRK